MWSICCDISFELTNALLWKLFCYLRLGVVSPIFRTHGCRAGQAEIMPNGSQCIHAEGMKPQGPQGSCGPNEVWSYGASIEPILSSIVRFRNDVLCVSLLLSILRFSTIVFDC